MTSKNNIDGSMLDAIADCILPFLQSSDLLLVKEAYPFLDKIVNGIVTNREKQYVQRVDRVIPTHLSDLQTLPAINSGYSLIANWRDYDSSIELLQLPHREAIGVHKLRIRDAPLGMCFSSSGNHLLLTYPQEVVVLQISLIAQQEIDAVYKYTLKEVSRFWWDVDLTWMRVLEPHSTALHMPYSISVCSSMDEKRLTQVVFSHEKFDGAEFLRMSAVETAMGANLNALPLLSVDTVPDLLRCKDGSRLLCAPSVAVFGSSSNEVAHEHPEDGMRNRSSVLLHTVFLGKKYFEGPFSDTDVSCSPTRILLKAGYSFSSQAFLVNPTCEFGGPWCNEYEVDDAVEGKLFYTEFSPSKAHLCLGRILEGSPRQLRIQLLRCSDGKVDSAIVNAVKPGEDVVAVLQARHGRLVVVLLGCDEEDWCRISRWIVIDVLNGGSVISMRTGNKKRRFYKSFSISSDGQLVTLVNTKDSRSSYCCVSAFFTATGKLLREWRVPVILSEAPFHEWDWVAPRGSGGFKPDIFVQPDESYGVSIQASDRDCFSMFSYLF